MILIDEILISQDIIESHFVCHLQKCKGACCYEGDYGAPLEPEEIEIIADYLEKIKPYLSEESISKIDAEGFHTKNQNDKNQDETSLMDDAACVFMGRDKSGITFCGIEKAYANGDIDFKKPISCHLYPIRVTRNRLTGFEALNYDKWDICRAACPFRLE